MGIRETLKTLLLKIMKKEVERYVGKKAVIRLGALLVDVTIKDYKRSYGRERFLVTPVSGSQEVWVEKINLIH